MRHSEPLKGQHHAAIAAVREVCQQLGMSSIAIARGVERLLVDRRGDDRVDTPIERQRNRPFDRLVGQTASFGTNGTDREFPLYCGRFVKR